MRAVVICNYELGRQPFGAASAAAWMQLAGAGVTCCDLAVQRMDHDVVATADLVAFYLPMHTAARLAVSLVGLIRKINPDAHLCFFGLYASVNEGYLRSLGAGTILGGEFEEGLKDLVGRLDRGEAGGPSQQAPVVSLARQRFLVPDRSTLPPLDNYAYLTTGDGQRRTVGYTEASRGCKHLCRHCPVVPVYKGHFRVVQREIVLQDVANQVAAGAQHITFGDPDFFNGPSHALAIVDEMHRVFPNLTYDATIKIEHLLTHADLLARLAATGCILITSAVESFDERILTIFDKCHTAADVSRVVEDLRRVGIGFNPTFVAFTPWTTRTVYASFLDTVDRMGLVPNVSPVQYAIRLLIPPGSKLLELEEVTQLVGDHFDPDGLSYRWRHPDSGMDDLFAAVDAAVRDAVSRGVDRRGLFERVRHLADHQLSAGERGERSRELVAAGMAHEPSGPPSWPVPYLSEPWYC